MQDFFIRAQDWILFAALTDRNKLVLPKAPYGFAVTGYVPFAGLSSSRVLYDLENFSKFFLTLNFEKYIEAEIFYFKIINSFYLPIKIL